MGNRLSKIYTKTGDDGTTGLGDGSRVSKQSLRVEAMGQVDHLNAHLGVVLAQSGVPPAVARCLEAVQHELFDLGAELCIPGTLLITEAHVVALERQLDDFNSRLGMLADFILPGGTLAAAHCHLARTACRNAEREVLRLHLDESPVGDSLRHYLNRLSDLLFVVARELNRSAGRDDVLWMPSRRSQKELAA